MVVSPATKARLLREMSLLSRDPPPGIAAYLPDDSTSDSSSSSSSSSDMTKIRVQITGPEPFESGIFLLLVNITSRYPFEPPRCRFLTPIYHPNIDSGGRICLDTLKVPPAGSWSPAVSLPSLLLSIRSLMAEPNPDDGLVPDISELYKRNPEKWREEARRRTKVDATNDQLVVMERSLDREYAAAATAMEEDEAAAVEDEKHVAKISKRTVTGGGVIANSNSTDGKEEKVVATTAEVASDDILQKNGRETKRSKLSSRK
jgi:ubiquitin-conjugating enzyme E2 T